VHPYVIVDVFTDVPLEGNQVAVFTNDDAVSSELMQRTARELNLSETVFVLRAGDGADARVRIFTPAAELRFAGHPVLGTAFVLGGRLGSERVRLRTAVGVIPIELTRDRDEVVFGEMQQPIPTPRPFEREAELLRALGVERSELPIEAYENGPLQVYVALSSEQAVAGLSPDMRALAALGPCGFSCFAGAERRFKTRMFAPGLGVAEDPATGSAAGPLAVHLCRHRGAAFGEQLAIRQGAEIGRPSLLHARVEGSIENVERVIVGGAAVIVARGEYRLD
jgi:trans-2,3-dihydro-3-hydroxyanthranilate isomerase